MLCSAAERIARSAAAGTTRKPAEQPAAHPSNGAGALSLGSPAARAGAGGAPTRRQSPAARGDALRPRANPFSGLFGGSKDGGEGEGTAPTAKRANPERFLMQESSDAPEFPPYTVVSRGPVYDLRLYDPYPVVEMDYERREEGYGALGGYVDGDNADRVRFAYSQPVIMRYYKSGRKVMQMYLGSRITSKGALPAPRAAEVSTLPTPNFNYVRLGVAGGELVAVTRFEGFITPMTVEAPKKALLAALKADGIKLGDDEEEGFFRCAQYGAVYQVGGRLNEFMLRVQP